MVTLFFIWIFFSVCCAALAKYKNRNGTEFFIYSMLFSPAIIFLVLLFLPSVLGAHCPACYSPLHINALKCPACLIDLEKVRAYKKYDDSLTHFNVDAFMNMMLSKFSFGRNYAIDKRQFFPHQVDKIKLKCETMGIIYKDAKNGNLVKFFRPE